MGNCTSGTKKTRKEDPAPEDKGSKDREPKDDVTYASIDHSNATGSRRTRAPTDDECDYTTLKVPSELIPESECSSYRDEPDYVLMS
ncbi:uncharacterized protein si:ch211-214p13.7 [Antennarius striatus]|uniref:uncharacterized protein si:ch211-214p13.7 n=1 Tax=Antennarius striatus TaxID=241820 RepID=UPI0035AE1D81